MSLIWCILFHRRHRYRTGERTIRRHAIWYTVRCRKCDSFDRVPEWFLRVD